MTRRALSALATAALVAPPRAPPPLRTTAEEREVFARRSRRSPPPVSVCDADDRLRLRNESGQPLVILGYQGEPYLVFRDGKCSGTEHSPATYLNDDRYGQVELPEEADPAAEPRWEEVAPRETYEWHDHRIHWMSTTLPPKVEVANDQRHHVFDWKFRQRSTVSVSRSRARSPTNRRRKETHACSRSSRSR